jgi:small ligand-binding sensory domain FIST
MAFAACSTETPDASTAADELCQGLTRALEGRPPDLLLLFVSRFGPGRFEELAGRVARETACRHQLACIAEGVASGGRELEDGPAAAALAAVFDDDAQVTSFSVNFDQTPDGIVCDGIPEAAAAAGAGGPPQAVLFLGDPQGCAVDSLIDRLEEEYPGVPLLGGMASGASRNRAHCLALDGAASTAGGVGVLLRCRQRVRSIVSQGCRPIGPAFVVTQAQRNVLFELGGKAALTRLEETYADLDERDRKLIQQGLHVGLAIDEYKSAFGRGDFLIANVLGADKESGAIALGNLVRTGQTVQFHVRDAEAADEDLRALLGQEPRAAHAAALLFSCNGRGRNMFPKADHDAGVIQEFCGPLPLAGMFARGELGPVGRKNFIHGFTASVVLFDGA